MAIDSVSPTAQMWDKAYNHDKKCSFCGKSTKNAKAMFTTYTARICCVCIGLGNQRVFEWISKLKGVL